ncbi:MAG: DUF4417 domain-containing protein [bacterium]|nr:DUF4417 domain-containing protein [bacterium]
MMQFNLLKWCDDNISYLKDQGTVFKKGIPQLSDSSIFKGTPRALSTFACRSDIPDEFKSEALITFYMFEEQLWPRMQNIDNDIEIFKNYAGIVGFDLSPSINMLRPRQRLSILINAIYSCYCAAKGIKVLPNYRAGDFGTICAADFFPDDCSFMIGNHGCINHGYKAYGEYQLDILLLKKKPKLLYVYGSLREKDAKRLIKKYGFDIVKFPDRRSRVRNNAKSYRYFLFDNKVIKLLFEDVTKGGIA